MRVAALGFRLLSISSVLAFPFKGGAGTELGSVLVKRGQELCPALYQEGPIQFFAFPQSVFVAVTSTTRTTTRSSTASTSTLSTTTVSTTLSTTRATTSSTTTTTTTRITTSSTTTTAFQVVCSSTPPSCEANGCSGTVAPAGTGNPTCKSTNFSGCACIPSVNTPGYTCPNQSCGANNCAGSFNNNGASATCKNYGAGCACAPTTAMCGNSASCDAGGCAGSFDNNGALATCKGNWATCRCNPTANTCGNQASCDAGGCAGSFDNNGAYATCKGNWATCRCNPTQGTGGTCGARGSCDGGNCAGSFLGNTPLPQVVVPTDATGNGMVILVSLGVQGTSWDAAVRLLRGPAGPAVIVRVVIAIIVRAPLPVTTPTLSALMPMRRATVIPRTIPAGIRKTAIRTGVMDNGTRVALLAVPVISSAAAVIRQGTHAAQERAASAMAAPDEGAVMASGAVLGDTLLVHAITTLSGVILIGMRVGRVVDMNSDRTRMNAFPDIALRNTSSGLRRIVDFNTNINPSFHAIKNILPTNPDTMKASFIFTLALAAAVTASPIERANLEKRGCPVGTPGYSYCSQGCQSKYAITAPCQIATGAASVPAVCVESVPRVLGTCIYDYECEGL
ncbi:hypothetical protein TWF970_001636 [Orbilia oligospora]|uniref:EGF-like domain-containing protein n=1 Tax=Orbilia oligospora TaxID=2813651 RepID=A0A7C8V9T3_ORBOL|nr:hypothetical protein TWF970_001636 [Orbilia oligospora]